MEHEKRWDSGKAQAAWWGHCKFTRDLWSQIGHSPIYQRSAKKPTFLLQTWPSVLHLHQRVTATGVSARPVLSVRKWTGGGCQTSAERSALEITGPWTANYFISNYIATAQTCFLTPPQKEILPWWCSRTQIYWPLVSKQLFYPFVSTI